eukprot:3614330-Rhodomonas_salina.2
MSEEPYRSSSSGSSTTSSITNTTVQNFLLVEMYLCMRCASSSPAQSGKRAKGQSGPQPSLRSEMGPKLKL